MSELTNNVTIVTDVLPVVLFSNGCYATIACARLSLTVACARLPLFISCHINMGGRRARKGQNKTKTSLIYIRL